MFIRFTKRASNKKKKKKKFIGDPAWDESINTPCPLFGVGCPSDAHKKFAAFTRFEVLANRAAERLK